MKILVLDDHNAFRDEIVAMLIRNGHEAHGVSMVTSAVSLVESGAYDVVLVDYNMPGHNGIWFMQNVKWPRRTKAILVTAHTNQQVINEMLINGASGYLIKPFDEEKLMEYLDSHSGPSCSAPGA
jgi:CheY-like chemotaxis protein